MVGRFRFPEPLHAGRPGFNTGPQFRQRDAAAIGEGDAAGQVLVQIC